MCPLRDPDGPRLWRYALRPARLGRSADAHRGVAQGANDSGAGKRVKGSRWELGDLLFVRGLLLGLVDPDLVGQVEDLR